MISKDFWAKIALNWITKDDGTVIPEIASTIGSGIPLDDTPMGFVDDTELDDILADLGIDI